MSHVVGPVTDWTEYEHGKWRRLGDQIEVFARKRIMPRGLIPYYEIMQPAITYVKESLDGGEFRYHWRVPVKGWTAYKIARPKFLMSSLASMARNCRIDGFDHDFNDDGICENCGHMA